MRSLTFAATLVFFGLIPSLYSSFGFAEEKINLWFPNGALNDVLVQLTQQFSEQNPGITVNIVGLPYEELKASIVRTVHKNLAPDIAIMTSENTAYAEMMKLSHFSGEDVYGLLLQRNNRLLMFYNKVLVDQPATRWEQIIEQAPALMRKNVLPVGVMFKEAYWFAHFTTLFSAQLTDQEYPHLDTLEMAATLSFYKQLMDADIIRESCGYDCVSQDFYAGKVAYAMNGVWAIDRAKTALGESFGITALPSLDGTPMKALASNILLTFPNDAWNGPKKRVIRMFAQFLRSKQVQMQIARNTNMLPIDLDWLTNEPQSQFHSLQIDLMHEVQQMPPTLSFVSIWNGIRKGLPLHSSGRLSAQDTADFMQQVARTNQQRLQVINDDN